MKFLRYARGEKNRHTDKLIAIYFAPYTVLAANL